MAVFTGFNTVSASFLHEKLEKKSYYFRTDDMMETTPAENLFRSENSGVGLIMLDYNEDECFLMTDSYVAFGQFDPDGTQKFDVNDENNIGYKLNNNTSNYLPSEVIPYLNTSHVWNTEPGNKQGNAPEQYSTVCGAALLSYDEYITYHDKFGMNSDGYVPSKRYSWWLRTAYSDSVTSMGAVNIEEGGAVRAWGAGGSALVRPVFYVNKNFFKNTRLDLNSLGENVKGFLLANFEKSDFTVYTDAELETIGFDAVSGGTEVKNASLSVKYGGTYAPNSTVFAECTFEGDADNAMYAWYRVLNEKSELIKVSRESFYTIGYEDMGYKIAVKIFPCSSENGNGKMTYVESAETVETQQRESYYIASRPAGAVDETPAENVFSPEGEKGKFILLDDFENPYADMYVMAMDFYGSSAYGTGQKFDSQESGTLAYKLNYSFFEEGMGGKILPQSIQWNINRDKYWLTEPGSPNGNASEQTVSKNGIGLLSAYEYVKYSGKFGIKDNASAQFFTWWLRTGINKENLPTSMLVVNYKESPGKTQTWATTGSCMVRPTFYLDRDFFKKQKINVYTAGKNVLACMAQRCTDEELSSLGYSVDEIEIINGSGENAALSFVDNSVVLPAENIGFTFDISGEGTLSYTVKDVLTGEETADRVQVSNTPFYISNLKNSIYEITAVLKQNEKIISYIKKTVTVMPKYDKQTDKIHSVNGFNVHYEVESEKNDKKNERMNYVNSEWTRTPFYYGGGDYPLTSWDKLVDDITDAGVEIFAVLIPNMVIDDDEDIDKYVEFAIIVAMLYDNIKYFEVSNEPNLSSKIPSAEIYGKMMARTADALHELNPEIKVVGGSMAYVSGTMDYLKTALETEDAFKKIDAVSYHTYTSNIDKDYERILKEYAECTDINGGWKKNIISEIGWNTSDLVDETQKSAKNKESISLIKQFAYAGKYNIFDTLIYNFRDVGENLYDTEHNFGVIEYDFFPKPAYISYNFFENTITDYLGYIDVENSNVMLELKKAGILTDEDYTNTEIHVFLKGGEPVLMMWNKGDEKEFNVGGSRFDIYGNSVSDKKIGNSPIYIKNISKTEELFKAVIASETDAFNAKWASVLNEEIKTDYEKPFESALSLIKQYRKGTLDIEEKDMYSMLYDYFSICKKTAKAFFRDCDAVPDSANADTDLISDYKEDLLWEYDNYTNAGNKNVTAFLINGLSLWQKYLKACSADDVGNIKLSVRNGKVAETGNTLMGTYTVNGEKTDILPTMWYVSESEDGEYTLIKENTDELVIYADAAGKYIKFAVDCGGTILYSDAVKIRDIAFEHVTKNPYIDDFSASGFKEKSNENNVFVLNGNKYVLLDVFDNDESTFLVASYKNFTENIIFSKTGDYFDVNEEDSLAKRLNTFSQDATGNKIPDEVAKYINKNHVWATEPGYNETKPRLIKAGVVVPAVWEIEKYKDILGWKDDCGSWGTWTRTAWNKPDKAMEIIHFDLDGAIGAVKMHAHLANPSGAAPSARPIFMLSREFFKDNVIDVQNMGSYVKKAVCSVYDREELSLYSKEDLALMGYEPMYSMQASFSAEDNGINVDLTISADFVSKNINVTVYTAFYDANNRLLKVDTNELTDAQFNSDLKIEKNYSVADVPSDTDNIRIFAWKSGEQKPLCDDVTPEKIN